MFDPLDGLNSHQRKAVEATEGRVLILAGAGSGKTRVLTMRMAYLIHHHKVSPKSILGLTFTNKAAAEMRHRVAELIPVSQAKQITLCTFHSFCMQILRAEIIHLGYTPHFTLYDEKDVRRLANMIARDELGIEGELPSLAGTLAVINMARNKGLKPEEVTGAGSAWHNGFTQTMYSRLQASMRAYNAVDFDSLLCLTVELLETRPHVLARYQDRFRYIMIDEYQDTNPIQYRLAALLSAKHNNLCVVGDDDQSIYGWRGADIRNILDFNDAYVVRLQQNYRSTNYILKAANHVIKNNTKRHLKELWSNSGDGELIEYFSAPNEINEAEAVACRIGKLREAKGLRWSDMAILYRSNILARQFETALHRYTWFDGSTWVRGIPYEVFGGQEFFEKKEVRDLFAYLRVIANPLDQEAILRCINQPRRGIGEVTLDALTAYNRKMNFSLWDVLNSFAKGEMPDMQVPAKSLAGIKNFLSVMEEAKLRFHDGTPLHQTLIWLIEKINFKKGIEEEVKSDQMRQFKWENVKEFISCLADYEEHCRSGLENEPTLLGFISDLPIEKDWEKKKDRHAGQDKIKLMTFHSAKGLEYKACFLVGVEDHIIPHEKCIKETGVEEERRLMYVAITRAMRHLTISTAARRKKMGQDHATAPSRFLEEIPKEFIKEVPWDKF